MDNRLVKQSQPGMKKSLKLLFSALTIFCISAAILSPVISYAKDTPEKNKKASQASATLSSATKRMQHLDNYSRTLKSEVIQLGRFLSDLAWVGSVNTGSNKKSASGKSSKNALGTDLLSLGKTLTKLEDGLLTPPGFQLIAFLSLDTGKNFILKEVNFEVNGEIVNTRKYTKPEVQALHNGGAHRLHIANLPEGEHSLTVYYNGQIENKQYQDKKTFTIKKSSKRKSIEFSLESLFGSPKIAMKEWD